MVERLNPLTLSKPKPLLKINEITLLENCINLIDVLRNKKSHNKYVLFKKMKLKIFLQQKIFNLDIKVINDGKAILNTGGGILNMMKSSTETNFITFNPDTVWNKNYAKHIKDMEKLYFSNQIKNILLLVNKEI